MLPSMHSKASNRSRLCWLTPLLLSAFALCGLWLTACTAPPQVVSLLFEPTPPPKAVVHQPRRPPYKTPAVAPAAEVLPEKPRTDWVAILELLPKDAVGGTDWVRALNENLIAPKPGLDPKAEDEPEIDLDVVLAPKDLPDFKATYPHKAHTRILACTNCHPAIFQMEKGADPITMEKIFAGEYCGRCHGKVAFDPITGCPRCHLEMPR